MAITYGKNKLTIRRHGQNFRIDTNASRDLHYGDFPLMCTILLFDLIHFKSNISQNTEVF